MPTETCPKLTGIADLVMLPLDRRYNLYHALEYLPQEVKPYRNYVEQDARQLSVIIRTFSLFHKTATTFSWREQ